MRTSVRERPTLDFDVLVPEKHWPDFRQFVTREKLEATGSGEDIHTFRVPRTQVELDVLVARSPLWREALQSFIERRVFAARLRVVKPDHLAAMKVKSYSKRKNEPQGQQDRTDIRELLKNSLADEATIRDILTRHRPDLLAELDEILRGRPA